MEYNGIIISSLPGSGKTTLANKLSGYYEWPIYSIGGLWREAWKKQYPDEEISFEDFWRGTSLEENREMNIKAKEIFREGRIIADSRYAIYADDLPMLSLFIAAPLNMRAKRASISKKYKGISVKEIENILMKREEDELRMGKNLIDESYDYRDSSLYHLVINSGLISIDEEFFLVRNLVD